MSNMEKVSIKGTLSYKDFKQHNFHHQKNILIGFFLFALLLVFSMLITSVFSGSPSLVLLISLVIAAIVAGITTLILILLITFRIRKEFKSDQMIKNELRYIYSDEGINQQIKKSNVYIEWADILKAYEHKEMFRVYISKNKVLVMPKRFFGSQKDITLFKALVNKHVGEEKMRGFK
ncbi:YcxB family protein [Salipaludibacillus sp. HK11]|uniref:YcxB family protein n=1 Tax=Salipaludibacillus sp. HK11 TaxID=3394320 RepID=UPI0039FC8DA5